MYFIHLYRLMQCRSFLLYHFKSSNRYISYMNSLDRSFVSTWHCSVVKGLFPFGLMGCHHTHTHTMVIALWHFEHLCPPCACQKHMVTRSLDIVWHVAYISCCLHAEKPDLVFTMDHVLSCHGDQHHRNSTGWASLLGSTRTSRGGPQKGMAES